MNSLILIGILWCLATSIASAQEADTSKAESTQSNPDVPQAPESSKAIVLVIYADSQKSEVVKEVIAALEKAGIAIGKTAETEPPANSSISVTLNMRKDESYDKIKQLVEALKHAGVQQMTIRAGGIMPEGEEEQNSLILDAQQGHRTDELRKIENAARHAAQKCGLSLVVSAPGAEDHGKEDDSSIPDETQSILPESVDLSSLGSQPLGLRLARAQLKNAQLKLAKLRLQVGDQHPSVKALELEIQAMESQLQPREELLDTLQGVRSELVEKNEAARKENGSQNTETARLETLIAQLDARIKSIEGTLEPATERVASVKVFALKYAQATDVVEVLKQVNDRGSSKIVPDERTNSVIVTGPEAQVQEIEALLLKLDEASSAANTGANLPAPVKHIEYTETHPKFVPLIVEAREVTSEEYKQQLAQLRTDYEAANKQAHDLAESLRQTPDAAKKAELRAAVQRAFTARQSLLRAELQEMQARLEKTQHSLDMRDRIADQIVDRRVEDLLNPQLEWDNKVSSETTGETAGSATSTANPSPQSEATSLPTELEGEWHLVAATDAKGKPVEFKPANLIFKNDQYTLAYQGGQIDRRVEVYPDSKEIRYFKDDSGFVQDHYLVEGDQLTIYNENRRNVYQRGHAVLPKTIPRATDEQKSRWRSGIVEILGSPSADKTWAPQLIGYGVIISPKMRIVSQTRAFDGDSAFYAKFDDGGVVPLKIVEKGSQGWLVFEPEQAIEANHIFRFSETSIGKHDEVHYWGRDTEGDSPKLRLLKTTVSDLERKSPALGHPVWQLLFQYNKLDGSLPVLDANGDLLAITVIGSNELLLAVSVSQLKTMFPKSFGQPSDIDPQPVGALPDWLSNLQGTWTVTESPIRVDENSGGQMKEIRINRDQWSIIWTAKPGDPDRVESLRVVRPDEKNLSAIDLVEPSTGKVVYPSLYELDRSGLTFCYGYVGERPDEISTGSLAVTIKLARQQDRVTP